MRKPHFDVCLSPELLPLYDLTGKVVVVVDVLRATSCMVTALAHGVARLLPVATLDECRAWQARGLVAAAERDGQRAEGFDLGNSPFEYQRPDLRGQTIAMTTTNGTLALTRSRAAAQVLAGAFLNLGAVADYLRTAQRDVLVVCAGWKGMVNLEDSLFGGALAARLADSFTFETDAPLLAQTAYEAAAPDLVAYLNQSAHVARLHRLGVTDDIPFCLTPDRYEVIPVLEGEGLVRLER